MFAGQLFKQTTEATSFTGSPELEEAAQLQLVHEYHGQAKITDTTINYTLKVPEAITDPRALLVVPGYLGIKVGYDNYADAVAQNGKPALILDPPRDRSLKAAYRLDYIRNPEDFACKVAYGVIRDARQEFGDVIDLEKVDGEGHSMGGRILAMVALRHPQLFSSTLFTAAAGLEDHSTADFLQERIYDFARYELIPGFDTLAKTTNPKAAAKVLYYVLRNPFRTLAEGIAVSNCDMRHLLPELADAGIPTAIRNFEGDKLTPNKNCIDELGNLVDICEVQPNTTLENILGHLALQIDPTASAQYAVDIFARLRDIKLQRDQASAA